MRKKLHGSSTSSVVRKKRSAQQMHTLSATTKQIRHSKSVELPSKNPLWFADDLTPEDLALAKSIQASKSSDSTASGAHEASQTQTQVLQWEGVLDEKTKRRLVLGEPVNPSPAKQTIGNYVAIDCEMVGVGPRGTGNALARVSIVNWHGHVVLDTFVKPKERVTDYRTWVSGVRPGDLKKAPSFATVQARVADIIKGRVLVGHAIQNDLRALLLSHPRPKIRDTAGFKPLQELSGNKSPGLRTLSKLVLGIEIQKHRQEHSSVEDAQATMAVFRTQKRAWDELLGIAKKEPVSNTGTAITTTSSAATTGSTKKGQLKRRVSLPSMQARPKAAAAWWEEEEQDYNVQAT